MTEGGARLAEALSWLESHVNLEAMGSGHYHVPTLDRISELCGLMGDPQLAYPSIHITGTNGKGSVARMVTDLLSAAGLAVGTYTSPDLESINERLCYGGVPVDSTALAGLLESLSLLEPMMADRPSRFELLTAAAFRWFADLAVDVAVIEVGLGGRWDATNVVAAQVGVVTNVELDHTELLGPTREDIASEKAGIAKAGAVLVVGEEDGSLRSIFEDAADAAGAELWLSGERFRCLSNSMALNGRMVDLSVPGGEYPEVFIPLHGAHQGRNAATALAAVDAFLGSPLSQGLVGEGFAAVRVPGRLEVMSREPLVILDGAHNPAGAACAGDALDEEFSTADQRIVVTGMLRGRDPAEMLDNLGASSISMVIACPAPSPRSQSPAAIVEAATSLGIPAVAATSVADGLTGALDRVGPDGMVLVTGSMYVVGAARTELKAAKLAKRRAT